MTKPLDTLWAELGASPRSSWPVYRRVDERHPLDLYAGISADGARQLLLISDHEPPPLKNYNAFELAKGKREDGRWSLIVELRKAEFGRLFAHLCEDLIESTRIDCSSAEAPGFVVQRIARWQRLLDRDLKGLLEEQAIRGLVGELLFLERHVIPHFGADRAVNAWQGPLDLPQDFRFPDRLVEIKSGGTGNPSVWISSAEQLDVSDTRLFLAVALIDSADSTTSGAFPVSGLVARISQSLNKFDEASKDFDDRLALAGYVDRPEYSAKWFLLHKFRFFEVTGTFPRLRRSQLDAAILDVSYRLDLNACTSFERTGWSD